MQLAVQTFRLYRISGFTVGWYNMGFIYKKIKHVGMYHLKDQCFIKNIFINSTWAVRAVNANTV